MDLAVLILFILDIFSDGLKTSFFLILIFIFIWFLKNWLRFSKKNWVSSCSLPEYRSEYVRKSYFEPEYGEINDLSIKLKLIENLRMITKEFKTDKYTKSSEVKHFKTSFLSKCNTVEFDFEVYRIKIDKHAFDPGGSPSFSYRDAMLKTEEKNLMTDLESSFTSEQNTEDLLGLSYDLHEISRPVNLMTGEYRFFRWIYFFSMKFFIWFLIVCLIFSVFKVLSFKFTEIGNATFPNYWLNLKRWLSRQKIYYHPTNFNR